MAAFGGLLNLSSSASSFNASTSAYPKYLPLNYPAYTSCIVHQQHHARPGVQEEPSDINGIRSVVLADGEQREVSSQFRRVCRVVPRPTVRRHPSPAGDTRG